MASGLPAALGGRADADGGGVLADANDWRLRTVPCDDRAAGRNGGEHAVRCRDASNYKGTRGLVVSMRVFFCCRIVVDNHHCRR